VSLGATVIRLPVERRHPRRLVPLAELIDLYGFSERWWRYQIAAGMPTHRFGKRALRFDPAEVEQWMEERSGTP
jgi:predicted DNA-binding transcriptional regulator AlpA